MLNKLKQIFSADHKPPARRSDLRLAAAVLLVEVARADYSVETSEEGRLLDILRQQYSLEEDELSELKQLADETADTSISLHRHLEVINRSYTPEQKTALLKMMWTIAYADGELHHYEEHLIRRVADLLYIPHKDFIRSKHQVIGEQERR